MKSLVWRSCKDALLVKEALVRKRVLPDPVFDHYKQVPEGVSVVWDSNPMWSFYRSRSFPKFIDLVQHVISEDKNLVEFAMFIWSDYLRFSGSGDCIPHRKNTPPPPPPPHYVAAVEALAAIRA